MTSSSVPSCRRPDVYKRQAQHHAVFLRVLERFQAALDLGLGKFLVRLLTPADEHLVGVVAVVMVVMMVVLAVLIMVMVAAAVGIVALVIVVIVMMMVVMVFMLVLVIVVMMMVMMFMLILVLVIMMVMMAAAIRVVALVIVVVMMMVVRLFFHFLEFERDGGLLLHGLFDLRAGQLRPRRGNDHGVVILLANQVNAGVELGLGHAIRAGEDDGVGRLNLVVVELAEVLHIHFALRRVRYGDKIDVYKRQAFIYAQF